MTWRGAPCTRTGRTRSRLQGQGLFPTLWVGIGLSQVPGWKLPLYLGVTWAQLDRVDAEDGRAWQSLLVGAGVTTDTLERSLCLLLLAGLLGGRWENKYRGFGEDHDWGRGQACQAHGCGRGVPVIALTTA